MALPGTRQSMIFDESLPGGFNLGMDANAFNNLGMANLANIQNAGLMGLPGAKTTVANPAVMTQLAEQVVQPQTPAPMPVDPRAYENLSSYLFGTADAPPPTVEDLYTTVLGRGSDPTGLQFWTNKLGPTVQKNELEEFYKAALPELAQTKYMFPGSQLQNVATTGTELSNAYDNVQQKTGIPTVPAEELEQRLINKEVSDSGKTTTQTAVDTSNFPKFEGTPYDPKAYENLVKQLTAQQQALESKGFKYGSTFGGAQETIADMAKRLAAMGISDIRDFGMKHELPVEKVYETIPGDEGGYMTFDTGKYKTISGFRGYDAENNPIFDYRELTPEEVEKLRFDKESGVGFLPIGMAKQADLMNTPYATTKYYNKKTGQEIDARKFGSKAESGLFASSGAGEGYTNYRVMYTDQGIPVFIPEKELSGMKEFVAKDLPGILSVLRFIPGAQLPVMLAQAASAAYMGADPKDILESLAKSYVASNLGNIVAGGAEKLGIDMPTSDLGKLAMQGGIGALSSLIQGGNLEQALKSGALSAAGSGISSLLPKGDGTFDYNKIIQALAPAIARGELSNADAFRLMGALVPGKKEPGKP